MGNLNSSQALWPQYLFTLLKFIKDPTELLFTEFIPINIYHIRNFKRRLKFLFIKSLKITIINPLHTNKYNINFIKKLILCSKIKESLP